MKSFSLSFLSAELENQYKRHNMGTQQGVFGRNLVLYSFAAVVVGIFSFIQSYLYLGLLCMTYGILITPLVYLFAQRGPEHFNYFCFLFQIALTLAYPIAYYFHIEKSPLKDVNTHIVGQSIIIVMQSFNLGSRFDLKLIVILTNILAQVSIMIGKKEGITVLTLAWVCCNFLYMNYIYWQDRVRRELFLFKYNEKLWQQQIGSCAQVYTISCASDKGQLQLGLNNCNIQAQEEFKINDLQSFKKFLNETRIVPKCLFSDDILIQMKKTKTSYKLMNLNSKLHRLSGQTINKNSEYIGFFNANLYDIKIFTTWNHDQILNIHILLTKSIAHQLNELELKYEYERKLFINYRIQSGISLKRIFVQLKGIVSMGQELLDSNRSLSSDIYNALRLNYNIQLFFKPSYKQNQINFYLLPLMIEIKKNAINNIGRTSQLTVNLLIDPTLQLFSCQKTLYQILFNLLSIIVVPTVQPGQIQITAIQRSSVVEPSYIAFCISTNIQTVETLLIDQNYHRKTNRQSNFQVNNQKIGLEILVSEYLLGQIGPKRRIKLIDLPENKQNICFSVYQDLTKIII